MGIHLLWTEVWKEHEARCRVIQRYRLFPLTGRKVLQMAKVKPLKPVTVREDEYLDAQWNRRW